MAKIALIMLTLNEEPRIADALKQFKPYVDYILVIDGESTDKTVQIAKKIADRVITLAIPGGFAAAKNYAHTKIPKDYTWLLYADADEKWDPGFLRNMKAKLREVEETLKIGAFRFPRINLPDGKNYPDYQCRLFPNSRDIEWKGELHEIPWFLPDNVALTKADETSRKKIVPIFTTDDYPIIHMPRRADIKRSWWQ
jgi:glycosyltransferase involved in cell wall biosynthesis